MTDTDGPSATRGNLDICDHSSRVIFRTDPSLSVAISYGRRFLEMRLTHAHYIGKSYFRWLLLNAGFRQASVITNNCQRKVILKTSLSKSMITRAYIIILPSKFILYITVVRLVLF